VSDYNNYPLPRTIAHYFTGPVSNMDNGFRTVPDLLRAVADWMDTNDVQDPEFENIIIKIAWPNKSDDWDDDFYQTATVYYMPNEDRGTTLTKGDER
jgi:hypothetical protein